MTAIRPVLTRRETTRNLRPPGEAALSAGFSFIIVMGLMRFTPHRLDFWFTLLCCGAFAALLWQCGRNRRFRLLTGIALTGGLLLAAFLINLDSDFPRIWRFFEGYARWVGESYAYEPVTPPVYLTLTALLVTAGISVPLWLLVSRRAHLLTMLFIGAALFFSMQLLRGEFAPELFLGYCLLLPLYEVWRGALYRLPGTEKRGRYLLYALPPCLLLTVCVWALPSSPTPLGQPLTERLGEFWVDIFGVGPVVLEEFSFAGLQDATHFGEDGGQLGGAFRQSGDKVLLYLEGERPMYLKGRTLETYTGNNWLEAEAVLPEYQRRPLPENRRDGSILPRPLVSGQEGTLEAFWQTQLFLEQFRPDGWAEVRTPELRETVIYLWDMTTRSVFLPSNLLDAQVHDGFAEQTVYRLDSGGTLTAEDRLRKEFSYSVWTPVYDVPNEQWEELYNLSVPGLTADVERSIREILYAYERGHIQTEPALHEYLDYLALCAQESETVYATCLQLPPELPRRVYELAEEIVRPLGEDATTYQKAKAIETYLAGTFPYNLEPPETPEGQDFVDFFLFDGKTGYCTYFASAMAVLCRAAGVPARYVEGFAPADQQIEDLYYVAAKDAHAWTEVYLDMFGWVQFEPTAPLSAAFSSSYFMGGGQSASSEVSSEAAMQAFLERAEQERRMREAMMQFDDTDVQPLTPAEDGAAGGVNLWWLLALLPLVPAAHTLRRRFYTWRLPKMRMTRVRAEWLYRRYLRLFRRVGLGRKRYETASEYGTRLDSLGWYYSVSMREVGGVFNAARFGRTPPDERGRVALLTMWDAREGIVRRKLGRGAAFAYKYVLGWI